MRFLGFYWGIFVGLLMELLVLIIVVLKTNWKKMIHMVSVLFVGVVGDFVSSNRISRW